jgi:GntR family transcriptional regulator
MIEVNLDRDAPMALHLRVAAEIRRAIAEGEAKPGDRLSPAVDFATVLGVNKNTVIRALHTLRDEGILDFTRGRGSVSWARPSEVRCSRTLGSCFALQADSATKPTTLLR